MLEQREGLADIYGVVYLFLNKFVELESFEECMRFDFFSTIET
jgi:hypothetical protein